MFFVINHLQTLLYGRCSGLMVSLLNTFYIDQLFNLKEQLCYN